MKIAVCIKQVPSTVGSMQIDVANHWLREADTTYETNSADLNALEEALRIKDRNGAEVLAISVGPDRVVETLKESLAKGADKAIHVAVPEVHRLDPREISAILADVLRPAECDMILAGLQSDDFGHGQTGVMIASHLGLPYVSIVTELALGGNRVRTRRELEGGWHQWVSLRLPCVLTIQSGINKPRYGGMKGMLAAKKKTIERVDVKPVNFPSRQEAESLYAPLKIKSTRMFDGETEEQASALIDALNLCVK